MAKRSSPAEPPGDGLAKLDEVMLSVEACDVGPVASGIVYCAVILECMQVLDLARAGRHDRVVRRDP